MVPGSRLVRIACPSDEPCCWDLDHESFSRRLLRGGGCAWAHAVCADTRAAPQNGQTGGPARAVCKLSSTKVFSFTLVALCIFLRSGMFFARIDIRLFFFIFFFFTFFFLFPFWRLMQASCSLVGRIRDPAFVMPLLNSRHSFPLLGIPFTRSIFPVVT